MDTTPVREHLQQLVAHNITLREVVRRTGLADTTLRDLYSGETTVVYRTSAELILAIEVPAEPLPTRYVPGLPTHRKMAALACNDWGRVHMGTRLGWTNGTMSKWTTQDQLLTEVAEAVDVFYRANHTKRGPNPLAGALARNQGKIPWYGWDDDQIDDPTISPYDRLPSTAARRRLRALAADGWGPDVITQDFPQLDTQLLEAVMRSATVTRVDRWVHNAVAHAYATYEPRMPGTGPCLSLAAEAAELRWPTIAAWDGLDFEGNSTGRTLVPYLELKELPTYSWATIWQAIGGEIPHDDLTKVEATYVVAYFRRLGWEWQQIAERMRWGAGGAGDGGAVLVFMADDRLTQLPPELAHPSDPDAKWFAARDKRVAAERAIENARRRDRTLDRAAA